MGQLTGKKSGPTTKTDASGVVLKVVPANNAVIPPFEMRPDALDADATYNPIPQRIAPIWPLDSEVDLTIVVSPTFVISPLSKVKKEAIVAEEKAFRLGDKTDKRVIETEITIPKEVQNNGTLWGHFYMALAGSKLDPGVPGYDTAKAIHWVYPLTQYLAKKKVAKVKNLLSASNVTEEAEEEPVSSGPIIKSFYHSNFTMSFVPDMGVVSYPNMHPAARQYVQLEVTGARDGSGQNGWYYPLLFINTFWQLRSEMTELNSTVTTLPFHLDLNIQANWLFSIIASVDEGAKTTARNAAQGQMPAGGGDGSEFEMFKEILIGTNIWLLGTTVIVSMFHMLFEMLAFSSDIVSSICFSVGRAKWANHVAVSFPQQKGQRWYFCPLHFRQRLHASHHLPVSIG